MSSVYVIYTTLLSLFSPLGQSLCLLAKTESRVNSRSTAFIRVVQFPLALSVSSYKKKIENGALLVETRKEEVESGQTNWQ